MSNTAPHRAGFVNIIGNPNVGKSTLMNALVGERLSIITSKAQTTRHRIMGIVNGEDYQIVYSDTPGILKPAYSLQESMMEYVDTAIGDADIILYVTDVVEKGDKNRKYVDRLAKVTCPVLIVINKIDRGDIRRFGQGEVRTGADIQPHTGAAARRRTVVRQGLLHRPQPALFRLGDYPREDTHQLRQGDSVLHRGGHRGIQGA